MLGANLSCNSLVILQLCINNVDDIYHKNKSNTHTHNKTKYLREKFMRNKSDDMKLKTYVHDTASSNEQQQHLK